MKQFNLEEYLKNPSRKVVTRDGRAVKIHCTNHIIDAYSGAVIAKIEGDTYSNLFREYGRYNDYEETANDLFFYTEKKEGWINVYKGNLDYIYTGCVYTNKEEAEEHINNRECYITTIKIEWEE